MNPNDALIEIRRLAEGSTDHGSDADNLELLRQKVRDLDNWMCSGGEWPYDWKRGPRGIKFTYHALSILTDKQRDTLVALSAEGHNELTVTKPASWDLGEGWLSAMLRYNGRGADVEVGVSPEGEAHS